MHLVLGTPGPVAQRVIVELVARGERVITLESEILPERWGAMTEEARGVFSTAVELLPGRSDHIDFGLSGGDYRRLLAEVRHIYLAESGATLKEHAEDSRLVRLAAEVREFVSAGGAPEGITFLSSLLVFGDTSRPVDESELFVLQGFADKHEKSLALAEQIIRSIEPYRALAIVRTAPIVAEEDYQEVLPGSVFAYLQSAVRSAGQEFDYVFTDLPTRWETVERATAALLSVKPAPVVNTLHLVDVDPLTDRQLVEWLAKRSNKIVRERHGSARAWATLTRSNFAGSRAVRGWGLLFSRSEAEAQIPDLLDRDEYETLSNIFPDAGAPLGVHTKVR